MTEAQRSAEEKLQCVRVLLEKLATGIEECQQILKGEKLKQNT